MREEFSQTRKRSNQCSRIARRRADTESARERVSDARVIRKVRNDHARGCAFPPCCGMDAIGPILLIGLDLRGADLGTFPVTFWYPCDLEEVE
jgi:hypothetical protein